MIAIPWFLDGGGECCILLLNSTFTGAAARGLTPGGTAFHLELTAELVRVEKQLKLSGRFALPVA
jgi:hypothetical protein